MKDRKPRRGWIGKFLFACCLSYYFFLKLSASFYFCMLVFFYNGSFSSPSFLALSHTKGTLDWTGAWMLSSLAFSSLKFSRSCLLLQGVQKVFLHGENKGVCLTAWCRTSICASICPGFFQNGRLYRSFLTLKQESPLFNFFFSFSFTAWLWLIDHWSWLWWRSVYLHRM